jgi:hypothetical protein
MPADGGSVDDELGSDNGSTPELVPAAVLALAVPVWPGLLSSNAMGQDYDDSLTKTKDEAADGDNSFEKGKLSSLKSQGNRGRRRNAAVAMAPSSSDSFPVYIGDEMGHVKRWTCICDYI